MKASLSYSNAIDYLHNDEGDYLKATLPLCEKRIKEGLESIVSIVCLLSSLSQEMSFNGPAMKATPILKRSTETRVSMVISNGIFVSVLSRAFKRERSVT